MFGRDLVGARLAQVRHSGIVVAEVYLGEAFIENDFSRMELELESQLFVIAGNKRASVLTSSLGTARMGQKAPREAGRVRRPVSPGSDTHMASFPLRYRSESSKSLKAKSNRSNKKLETPHWK